MRRGQCFDRFAGDDKKLSYRRENSALAMHFVIALLLSIAVITETCTPVLNLLDL